MSVNLEFQPVVIGTDLNAYNVARAFNMEYGIKSQMFGRKKLMMVNYSKICNVTEVSRFAEDDIMIETLINYAKANPSTKLILFAASEQYVFRIFKNYEKLKEYYLIPYAEPELGLILSDKMNFYSYCDKYNLDYPKAEVITKASYDNIDIKIDYPVVLKPIESSDYFNINFEGKEKVYILQNEEEVKVVLRNIYETGYQHNMVIQEYIRGDVTNEYVMNVYSDTSGKVKLMSLGRVLIEDPQPDMRGNYVAITNPIDHKSTNKIYQDIKRFLESINFTGLSNFDLKYDEKDGRFKVFEINMRQGRSSFFSILAGANYAMPIVEDLIKENTIFQTVYGDRPFVWINCSKDTFMHIIKEYRKDFYEEICSIDNIQDTLYYKNDLSLLRKINLNKYFKICDERLWTYFKTRKDVT
ncbi:hypothetical protein PRVXT_000818 [Proteinivorax tanatarense]|uniref:ATP-grasp domain-containing protein n=1 Tax=Proteinivorax tanatarense TaxID=1260629 RepID=A0AAU7VNY4_9FIRM